MNQRILILIIIVLVILNVGTLGVIWMDKKGKKQSVKRERSPRVEYFLKEKVGFSEEQIEEFRSLQESHMKESMDIRMALGSTRRTLYDQIKMPEGERLDRDSIIRELSTLHQEFEERTFLHFQDLRAICNEDQLEQFDAFISGMQEQFNRHRRNPRRMKRQRK